jgi:hypothetical protein
MTGEKMSGKKGLAQIQKRLRRVKKVGYSSLADAVLPLFQIYALRWNKNRHVGR